MRHVAGYLALGQEDLPAACSLLEECRTQANRDGDDYARRHAAHALGTAAFCNGDYTLARELLTEALAHSDAHGESSSDAVMMALMDAWRGDIEGGIALCRAAAALCEPVGEQWAQSYVLFVLGFIQINCSRPSVITCGYGHDNLCSRVHLPPRYDE